MEGWLYLFKSMFLLHFSFLCLLEKDRAHRLTEKIPVNEPALDLWGNFHLLPLACSYKSNKSISDHSKLDLSSFPVTYLLEVASSLEWLFLDYKEIKSIIVEIHFTYIHHFSSSIAGILNQDNDKCLNLKACKSTNRFSKSALASVPVHSGLTLATRVLVVADQLNFFLV